MKIGILTLSASDNCGSLLQAYALKKALEKYGLVEIINFSSKESHAVYDVPHYCALKRFFRKKEIQILSKASNDYKNFRHTYMHINGKELFYDDLKRLSPKYDVMVVGSDQVWNVKMGDFSESFFLGWTNSKKVAYAPSLGGTHLKISSDCDYIKKWLEDFSFISVREESGKRCLEEVIGRKVPKLLDPTLIVDAKTWESMVDEPLIKGDYIFYYSWAYCEKSTSQIVSDTAKKNNIPVYVIDPRKWLSKKPSKYGFRLYEKTGPLVFLNLMKYAKMCYVESFHGMVFAYIFKKNFWLLDTHKNISELDSRLMEFVNLFNVQNRILTKYNVNEINQEKDIEYKHNELLSSLKIQSWNFLDQALREA